MPRPKALPEWNDYLARWAPVADRLVAQLRDPSDAYDRQALYQMMLSALAGGHFGLVSNDPDYPEFVPMLSSALNFAAPVPDFVYTYAPIDGAGTYRIAGHRGTSLFAVVTVSETYFTRTDKPKPGLANYDVDELTIGTDGRFEVLLSAEKPEDWRGDWWYMDPKATNLGVRHAMYDWENEIDPRMSIERLDIPAARPKPTASEIAERMEEIAQWMEYSIQHWLIHLDATRKKGIVNRFEVTDYSGFTGSSWPQVYLETLFEIAEDEALVIETAIPDKVRYWSFMLADELFATIDWTNRQSSLNGHQARLDARRPLPCGAVAARSGRAQLARHGGLSAGRDPEPLEPGELGALSVDRAGQARRRSRAPAEGHAGRLARGTRSRSARPPTRRADASEVVAESA